MNGSTDISIYLHITCHLSTKHVMAKHLHTGPYLFHDVPISQHKPCKKD